MISILLEKLLIAKFTLATYEGATDEKDEVSGI